MKQASMRCPSMPINPPQPTFNSMATIDFMGMAKAQTAFAAHSKIEFQTAEEPVPTAPVFTDVPSGTRWSKNAAASLGAEDTRPAGNGKAPIKGWQPYEPAPVSDDPMGDGGGEAAAAVPRAPSAAAASRPAAGRGASPPPAKRAAQPPPARRK